MTASCSPHDTFLLLRVARRSNRLAAAALALGLPLLVSCEPKRSESDTGTLEVVATTGMIADAARIIGGERARVTGLMGPGVDPHIYRMSRSDQKRLKQADLVLYHGLHLEGKMADFLSELRRGAQGDDRQVVQAVAEVIPRERLIRNELFGEYPDPHVWFDLELWKMAVEAVIEAYERRDPDHAAEYRERGDAYIAELDRLHRWALAETEKLPPERRKIVTSHDAYNYFARAYGFEVHGLQGISTETEAGLKDIQEAVRYILDHDIPVIFAETSVSRAGIQRVARSAGSRISERELYSDALGERGTEEGTFTGMFRYNLETIVEELGGDRVLDGEAGSRDFDGELSR